MHHSTRAPTKYEAERIEAMKRLGCVACAVLGVPNLNALELHHILDGGRRMGHWFSIFLCRGHHQGDWSAAQHVEEPFRVAISDGRKRFTPIYGTERQLWERVQTKLKLTKVWPVSKRVPREGVRHAQENKNAVEAPPDYPAVPTLLPRGVEELLSDSRGAPGMATGDGAEVSAPAGEAR